MICRLYLGFSVTKYHTYGCPYVYVIDTGSSIVKSKNNACFKLFSKKEYTNLMDEFILFICLIIHLFINEFQLLSIILCFF